MPNVRYHPALNTVGLYGSSVGVYSMYNSVGLYGLSDPRSKTRPPAVTMVPGVCRLLPML